MKSDTALADNDFDTDSDFGTDSEAISEFDSIESDSDPDMGQYLKEGSSYASNSLKQQDTQLENDWSNIKFLILCVIVILVAFTLFGVVIYFTNKHRSKQEKHFSRNDTSTTEFISKGCGSNSFMIRDGVCDEESNIEVCLYDGGDCCLEKKSKRFCKVCTCLMAVNVEELKQKVTANEVKVFKNYSEFENLLTAVVKIVTEVNSSEVCALLCLDEKLDQISNSWLYKDADNQCWCTVVKSTFLGETSVSLLEFETYKNESLDNDDIAFVQLLKLFTNGIKIDFLS